MADTTRAAAENFHPYSSLTDAQKDTLVTTANEYVDRVLGGKTRTLPEVEGKEQDIKSLIAAHLWVLAEGGEQQSEGQSGGNVSYSNPSPSSDLGLEQTRYGRMAKTYLRGSASIGVELA